MNTQMNRQKQALATKQKIFSRAISLFARQSYENVTVQDICAEADVSVGAFYHHFKSKENILDEGYRRVRRCLEHRASRLPQGCIPIFDRRAVAFYGKYGRHGCPAVF